ncbi:hypothetical protein MWU65_00450 [Cellulophaga sp. F20128]|uniref:hypothetical protein n=1 Tax=Cellulophaga sp. F20128 TaxID=2926413 RepID=UPI001FF62CD0|nr:hypothetical protein [Cellulophaga sp. F20128]MCK0155629.1 hypothetical protein [Cellulophaga sp. F20128]
MQKAALLLSLFLCFSCDFFETKELKAQKMLDQEMKEIDWNTLDQFPLFDSCDEMVTKEYQQKCFENTFLKHFSTVLGEFEFILDKNIKDTVHIDFLVDATGEVSMIAIEENAAVTDQIPGFTGIVARGLKDLPPLKPALKRGIPVKAMFRIPLIINTK